MQTKLANLILGLKSDPEQDNLGEPQTNGHKPASPQPWETGGGASSAWSGQLSVRMIRAV